MSDRLFIVWIPGYDKAIFEAPSVRDAVVITRQTNTRVPRWWPVVPLLFPRRMTEAIEQRLRRKKRRRAGL